MSYDTATPYIASYVILRDGNKICFVLRENTGWMDGFYGMPAGKVEKNESFSKGAIREAFEEVAITIKPENLKFLLVSHRKSESEWVDVFFEATEWEGDPYNAEPQVHSKVEWLDLDNLPENIIPNIRFCLEQIAAGKHYAEYDWE